MEEKTVECERGTVGSRTLMWAFNNNYVVSGVGWEGLCDSKEYIVTSVDTKFMLINGYRGQIKEFTLVEASEYYRKITRRIRLDIPKNILDLPSGIINVELKKHSGLEVFAPYSQMIDDLKPKSEDTFISFEKGAIENGWSGHLWVVPVTWLKPFKSHQPQELRDAWKRYKLDNKDVQYGPSRVIFEGGFLAGVAENKFKHK